MQQTQIREQVFDFTQFVKPARTDDFVRNAAAEKFFAQTARLRARAIKHRDIFRFVFALCEQAIDFARDQLRLFTVILRFENFNRNAARIFGPQIFVGARRIASNDRLRHIQNGLCRAIILFEQIYFGIRKIFAESHHIAIVRAAPSVNGIVHHDAVGDVIVNVRNIQVVHRTVILFKRYARHYIIGDFAILKHGHNHRGMDMARRMQIERKRHPPRGFVCREKCRTCQFKVAALCCQRARKGIGLRVIEIRFFDAPCFASPRARVIPFRVQRVLERAVCRIKTHAMRVPWACIGASRITKHAQVHCDAVRQLRACDAFRAMMREFGKQTQILHQCQRAFCCVYGCKQLRDICFAHLHVATRSEKNGGRYAIRKSKILFIVLCFCATRTYAQNPKLVRFFLIAAHHQAGEWLIVFAVRARTLHNADAETAVLPIHQIHIINIETQTKTRKQYMIWCGAQCIPAFGFNRHQLATV